MPNHSVSYTGFLIINFIVTLNHIIFYIVYLLAVNYLPNYLAFYFAYYYNLSTSISLIFYSPIAADHINSSYVYH